MKATKRSINKFNPITFSTEAREKGEVTIFKQKISVENAQPAELQDIISVVTNDSERSRTLTIPSTSVNTSTLKLEELKIIQITSNRPIGISASSGNFGKQVDFQAMNINGESIKNSSGEQLYHMFVLSEDSSDVSLTYSTEEKKEELAKANELLGVINVPDATVVENEKF